jgi:hypothetical protein
MKDKVRLSRSRNLKNRLHGTRPSDIVLHMQQRLCILVLVVSALAGGCASKTQRTPPLTPAATKPQPPQRDMLKEAGDATWQVVTAPARLVTPRKAENKEPETFEAPAAMIIRRSPDDDDAARPAPAPQTRP